MLEFLENKWIHLEGYYHQRYTNFSMNIHSHNRLELMYCTNGFFIIEYLDHNKKNEIKINENCFILINPNVPHRLIVENNCSTIINLEFNILPIRGSFNFSNLLIDVPKQQNREVDCMVGFDNGNIKNILNIIISSISPLSISEPNFYMDCLIYSLFYNILYINTPPGQACTTGYKYLKQAIFFIHQNLNHPISLQVIAKDAGISVSYLKKLFKASYNTSVNKYITTQRINKAKMLLINTSITVDEIALSCGYMSRQSLNKVFKQELQLTPYVFRKTFSSNKYYYSPFANETFNKYYCSYFEDEAVQKEDNNKKY